jgi:predicted O-methyltransferase YrrM
MAKFTTDWISTFAIPNFHYVKEQCNQITNILEIGSFEGRSACWMLTNLLDDQGTLTCIDPFPIRTVRDPLDNTPSRQVNPFKDIVYTVDDELINIFNSNIAQAKKPGQTVNVLQKVSYNALAKLIVDQTQFDFIYIDGCHQAQATLSDACMCFGMLKPGGFMLFDDYLNRTRENVFYRGKISIDAFVNIFYPDIAIHQMGYQVLIQKKE